MSENRLHGRIVNKHDIEANWLKAENFKPMLGEIVVYDADETYPHPRIKVGDGETTVSSLPFAYATTDEIVSGNLMPVSADAVYNAVMNWLTIDYDTYLAFDTTEIVFGGSSPILGQAILGQLVLA